MRIVYTEPKEGYLTFMSKKECKDLINDSCPSTIEIHQENKNFTHTEYNGILYIGKVWGSRVRLFSAPSRMLDKKLINTVRKYCIPKIIDCACKCVEQNDRNSHVFIYFKSKIYDCYNMFSKFPNKLELEHSISNKKVNIIHEF